MNLSIPPKVYQLITAIGVFLVGYSTIQMERYEDEAYELHQQRIRSIQERERFTDKMTIEIDRFNEIESLPNENQKNQKLQIILDSALKINSDMDSFNKNHEWDEMIITQKLNRANRRAQNYFEKNLIGGVFFIVGMIFWFKDETTSGIIQKSPSCQSCGRKFSATIVPGSDKDKKVVNTFCSTCYQDGEFTNPKLDVQTVINQAFLDTKLKNRYLKNYLGNKIKSLDRWSDPKY